MKRSTVLAAGLLFAGVVTAQSTSCPSGTTQVTGNLRQSISGVTMCARSGGDRWQEFHDPNGDLVDYKLGTDPRDPTSKVGTWSATNGANATLTHTYGGTSYSWLLCQQGSANNYTLVSTGASGTITGVTLTASGPAAVSCG